MKKYDDYYEDLVELIYQIPLNPQNWNYFASRLNEVLEASLVQIAAMDLKQQVMSYCVGKGTMSDDLLATAQVMHLHYPAEADPRWPRILDPQRQGWYQSHTHIDDTYIAASDLYQEILLPIGLHYLAVHDLLWDNELCVVFGVHTSKERQPLGEEELAFLNKLLPHLRRIVAIQRYLYTFSNNAIVGHALVDKLSNPVLLLNLAGFIVHQNTALEKLSSETQLFKRYGNRLILPEPFQSQLHAKLQQIEHSYRHQQLSQQQKFEDECIKLSSETGESLYIFVSLLISEQEMRTFGIRPLMMLTFYHPDFTPTVDVHLLRRVFHLSVTESQVVLLFIEGYSVKEIAQKHRVESDTIRKQLQSIYKKTSTSRQAELVKLLLNLPRYNGSL